MRFVLVISWVYSGTYGTGIYKGAGVLFVCFSKQHPPKYQAMEVSNKYICVQWERLVFPLSLDGSVLFSFDVFNARSYVIAVENLSTGAKHRCLIPEQEAMIGCWIVWLEAFAVDDAWAGLVVFLLGDPHLLESGQRSQDGPADPDGVFALRGSNDL